MDEHDDLDPAPADGDGPTEAPAAHELPTMFVPVVDDEEAPPAAAAPVASGKRTKKSKKDDDRKGMATSTKIVLVAAVWVLFTLFLVGRFKADKQEAVSTTFGATPPTLDDGGTPDVIDTPEEEAADTNGDGVLDEGEKAAANEELARASEEASAGGTDGSTDGGTGSGYEGVPADPSAVTAKPGAAPTGSTTTTAAGGGSATTAPNATTTTKKPGSTTTTTVAPTTVPAGGGDPTTTTAAPAEPVDRTITVTGTPGAFLYAPQDFSIPAGSRVKMSNLSNKDHTWKIGSAAAIPVPKGGETDYHTFANAGTFAYRCTIHSGMNGTITVT